jgi:hypothetical protein
MNGGFVVAAATLSFLAFDLWRRRGFRELFMEQERLLDELRKRIKPHD